MDAETLRRVHHNDARNGNYLERKLSHLDDEQIRFYQMQELLAQLSEINDNLARIAIMFERTRG